MDEKREKRMLMIAPRLYAKLKARAKQLTRERRQITTYSQVVNELLESMETPPDFAWPDEASVDSDEEPDEALAAAAD